MTDDTSGKARHVKGKVKEGVGELLGDRKMQREGKLEQFEGQAQQDAARAEEHLKKAVERETAARNARKSSESL